MDRLVARLSAVDPKAWILFVGLIASNAFYVWSVGAPNTSLMLFTGFVGAFIAHELVDER